MNRRAFVARLGAAVGVGVGTGCVGPPGGEATTRDDDRVIEAGGTAVVGDRTVQVADARLAEAVLLDHDRFRSVERRDGWQFVLADVHVGTDDDALEGFEFGLVVGGETHRADFEPTTALGDGPGPGDGAGPGDSTDTSDGPGQGDRTGQGGVTIGLPVPVAPASRAGIVVERGGESATWRLGSDLVARFDRVPAFAVREVRIEPTDGGVAVVLAVENEGDRDGTFRALAAPADVADVEHPVVFDVPVGETVVHERPLGGREGSGDVQVVSAWSADSRRFEYG